ncbi:MAG: ABC transporter substrate-binding protein [Gammaproteobacteria bacterium]|nr:ABC transporter substrate-binding protein [Gammaproteobacteria bacterium]
MKTLETLNQNVNRTGVPGNGYIGGARGLIRWLLVLTMFVTGATVAAEHPAQTLVKGTVDKFLDVVRNNEDRIKNDPAFLNAKIEELVVPHLDFESMTKLSIGKNWKKANASQQKELVAEFRTFLLNTYTSAIDEYKNGEVSFEKFKPGRREDRAVVRSQFTQAGTADVPVVYKLRDKGGWRIYDIEVSQLSLVTNYRSSFSSEIARNGIDGLINLLKERNGKAG